MTSTRGRPSTSAGTTSKPVTRRDAASQVGRTPISASAWAMSSPPVRMFDVPQAESAIARGQAPCSWACRSTSICADFHPRSQAAGVGTVRVSTE